MPRPETAALAVALAARAVVALALGWLLFGRPGDLWFFYVMGEQSAAGRLPYLDFWVEYPPLFPWLVVGLYQVAALAGPGGRPLAFALLLSALNLLVDGVAVALVYSLRRRIDGPRQAFRAALAYALLPFPVVFAFFGTIEPLATALLLAALWLGLRGRALAAGVAAAAGVLTKLYPLLALPGLILALPRRERSRLLAACALPILLALAALEFVSPLGARASLEALTARPAWGTPWSLLEGWSAFGSLTPPPERGLEFPDADRGASALPWTAISAGFALLYAAVLLARRALPDARATAALTLFGLALLQLWSRGHSPQFAQWLLPLLMLALPLSIGLALALGLTALLVAHYGLFIADPNGANLAPYVVLIGTRTVLLVVIALLAARVWLRAGVATPMPRMGAR